MPIFKLHIPDIVCPACAEPINNVLSDCEAVTAVNVDVVHRIATVTTSETDLPDVETKQRLCDAVNDIGFPVKTIDQVADLSNGIRHHWIKGWLGVLSGAAILALHLGGVSIPVMAMRVLAGISSVLTLYLGKDTYKHAVIQLVKAKTVSMESLFTVSTLVSLGVSCASFFVPSLPSLFDAGLFILGFKNIGDAIKASAKQQVAKKSFLDYAPETIEVETPDKTTTVCSVKEVLPEQIIVVRSGQTVPVNAICLNEQASLYNTRITGRTMPACIRKGDTIYAGAVVPNNIPFIRLKVTAKASDSYLAQLDQALEQAASQKAPIEISTNKILTYFVVTVFAIAAISSLVVGVMMSPMAAIQCGISILTSACPCTLGLMIPLAIKTGMTKAAEQGVHFKSGKSMQSAADIDTVVLDLNGTLTTGVATVVASTISSSTLSYVAAIEKEINHPIAKAIFNYASKNIKTQTTFKKINVDQSDHSGVVAEIENEMIAIGNADFMEKIGIMIKPIHAEHVVYIARNNKAEGFMVLNDPLRDDAKQTIQSLKQLGKHIHLCTGSDLNTAITYANALGIPNENIRANCSSREKITYIEALSQQGRKIAMVGDAANDAAAVIASHLGIAIQSVAGDRITQQHAGVVIPTLWPMVNAFTIANQTVSNIKQNLAITITYNVSAIISLGGLFAAVGCCVNPAIGALCMVAQMGLVLANLERFKRQSVPSLQEDSPAFIGAQTQSQSMVQPSIDPMPNCSSSKREQCITIKEKGVCDVVGQASANLSCRM